MAQTNKGIQFTHHAWLPPGTLCTSQTHLCWGCHHDCTHRETECTREGERGGSERRREEGITTVVAHAHYTMYGSLPPSISHRFPRHVLLEGGRERDGRYHGLAIPLLRVLTGVDSLRSEMREVLSDKLFLLAQEYPRSISFAHA